MDAPFIYLVLAFLALATAMNSFFLIRAAKMIEAVAPAMGAPSPLPEDTPLPAFSGRMAETNAPVDNASLLGKPCVIIFTAPGCAACEGKKPEILKAQQDAEALGVRFLAAELAPQSGLREKQRENRFSRFAVKLDKKSFYRLNPAKAMPLYIFLDENGTAKASGMIGDENWVLFTEQVAAPLA